MFHDQIYKPGGTVLKQTTYTMSSNTLDNHTTSSKVPYYATLLNTTGIIYSKDTSTSKTFLK